MAKRNSSTGLGETDKKGKQKEKEILVIYDAGRIEFDTGDVYDGYFEIKKKERSFKMLGPGVYTTAEGDVYSGTWDYNRLVGVADDEVTIEYHSGAKYEGGFQNWTYSGKSRYTYPDGVQLACAFNENCPQGELTLKDPNGHIWNAKADQGYAWFDPINHYYDSLDRVLEKSKKRGTPKPTSKQPLVKDKKKKK